MEQNSGVNTECKCKKNVFPLILITIALLGCMAVMIFLALQVKDGMEKVGYGVDRVGARMAELGDISYSMKEIENNTDGAQFSQSFVIDKIMFSAGPTSYTILQTTSTKTYTAYFYDAGYVMVTCTEDGYTVEEKYIIPLSSIYYIYED